ncbi:MAG: protein kinase domain-containing protein [Gammaproteobacteria bacterium]
MSDVRIEKKSEILFTTTPFPYIPSQIKYKHLHPNGLLIPDTEISALKARMKSLPDGKYDRSTIKTSYDTMKVGDNYFLVYDTIGYGAFGAVFLVQHLDEQGIWYAAKVQDNIPDGDKFTADEEYKKLEIMSRAVGEITTQIRDPNSGDLKEEHTAIMQFHQGIRLSRLLKTRNFNSAGWLEIAIGTLESVQELHTKYKLYHRDLKPKNIMYDPLKKAVTLIDFGLSIEIPPKNVYISDHLVGSPHYLAPECSDDKKQKNEFVYSDKSEVFALGKTFQEIFTPDRIPYQELFDNISNFIESMLDPNPMQRPTISECLIFFKKLYQETLKLPYAKIGFLDEKEYISSSSKEQLAYLKALQQMDEVWLIDPDKSITREQHVLLQRRLEKLGISINDKLHHASSTTYQPLQIINAISSHLTQTEKAKIYHYYYVTQTKLKLSEAKESEASNRIYTLQVATSKKPVDYREELISNLKQQILLPQHSDIVIKTLQDEITRLTNIYLNKESKTVNAVKTIVLERIDILKLTIEQFRKGEFKTYYAVFERLNAVQREMLKRTTSKKARFFSRIFTPYVRTADKIEQVKKRLIADFISFRKK